MKGSMSKLRSLNTGIWNDTWFEELSVDRKLLFIYLITNEKTNMLGIYEISIKKISFETGIPADKVTESFVYFEKSEKIKYQNNRVILLNFLKHQNYNLNMNKSAIDCYNELPNSLKIDGELLLERDDKGFETLSKGFGMVRKIEVEYELEEELEEEEEEREEIEKLRQSEFFKKLTDYFSQNTEPLEMKVFSFLVARINNGEFEEFQKQTLAYMEYKSLSKETVHRWFGYSAEWKQENWIDKLKKLESKSNQKVNSPTKLKSAI